MTIVKLRVSDAYKVPDVIGKLTCEETEAVLDTTALLVSSNNTANANELKTQLVQTIKQTYNKKLEGIKESLEQEHKTQIENLQCQLQALNNQNNSLKGHIEKDKGELVQRFEKDKEFIKQIHERALSSKEEAIIQLTAQIAQQRQESVKEKQEEINQVIANVSAQYKEQVVQLTAQIAQQRQELVKEKQNDIASTKAEYVKEISQMKEQMIQQRQEYIKERHNEINQVTASIKAQYKEQIEELQKMLEKMKDELQMLNSEKQNEIYKAQKEYVEQINNIKNDTHNKYQGQIDTHVEQIKQLRIDMEAERETFKEALVRYDSIMKEKNSDRYDDVLKCQQEMMAQLQPVIKFHGGTNEEKGTLGEQSVMNVIKNDMRYTESRLVDTSGQTARGDFHMYWGKIKCMFEVKNKKVLTVEDMSKFERDVREASGEINCAVFVSLRTDVFPNRSREIIQLDMVGNVPVVYVYLSEVSQIHYAIICVKNVVGSASGSDERSKKLVAYFQRYTKDVAYYYEWFSKQLKQKQSEIRGIQKEISRLGVLDEELNKNIELLVDVNGGDEVTETDSDAETEEEKNEVVTEKRTKVEEDICMHESLENSSVEESIEKVVRYYILYSMARDVAVGVGHITEHFSVSQTYLLKKLGGIKHIQKLARTKIFREMIGKEVIKRLKLYKASKGEYPKRPELIKKYISQRTLAKLNKVFRTKRIMEAVYEMIDGVEIEVEEERSSDSEVEA